jgi:hypothetical protein
VRPAECEGTGDADRAEGVESIGIGEGPVLRSRVGRIVRSARLPVMMLDASHDSRDLCRWEFGLGQDIRRGESSSLRVFGPPGGVPHVMQ